MKLPIENREYSTEITTDNDGERASIAGWVHEKRDLGGSALNPAEDIDKPTTF